MLKSIKKIKISPVAPEWIKKLAAATGSAPVKSGIVAFCIPDRTDLHKYKTVSGYSKREEWLQVQGAPCKIIAYDDESGIITLNSLTSSPDRIFDVSIDYFKEHFTFIYPRRGFLRLEAYKVHGKILPIHIREFEKRTLVNNLIANINKIKKNTEICDSVKGIFGDKLGQLIVSQGAPYNTITEYKKFISGEIKLTPNKRFGHEIFNRNNRWCPPVDISYEEFKTSPSYPAPLGIRPKDFCLPSELVETMKEMINQIVNFTNFPQKDYRIIKKILPFIRKRKCRCKYCGKCINFNDYSSTYMSADNFIEICHRDPEERYIKRNMYWGHGECNRRQGGYSEEDRVRDGLILLLNNPRLWKEWNERGIIDDTMLDFLKTKKTRPRTR